jgi:hypothetical protein
MIAPGGRLKRTGDGPVSANILSITSSRRAPPAEDCNTLQGLHPKGEFAAILCLREGRHICVDDAGRDTVDTNAARAECRSEMLHPVCQSPPWWPHRPGNVPTAACAASKETRIMLLPLRRIGSNCWTTKNGARTLTAKRWSKSSIVVSSIVADFETPALGTRISSRSPTRPRSTPAVQVKPRFETAGFRVFQNFREFPRVVLRKVQRRYGLRSSTSWHSSLSVRLFEGHGIFGGRWTSRLCGNAWSMRSTSDDALDLTRCEDRRRHCHV